MTIVLDAYAVIAAVAGEPAAQAVDHELRSPGADVRISAVNLAEVLDQLLRVARLAAPAVERSLQLLSAAGVSVVPADEQLGFEAGSLRARHYRRGSADVSLSDCFAVATAASLNAAVATADPALATMARVEVVRVVALPDSKGRLP
ncbi:MAG: PIN domain-containing protein [Candidatus Dormibacteria bacterium]